MEAERAEGWYTDPYGRHEARWMSGGTPTELVRDRGVESYDAPPDEQPSQTPEPVAEEEQADGQDLLGAGGTDSRGRSRKKRTSEAAESGPTGGSHVAGPEISEDE